jgi:hypothetical protein
MENLDLNYEQRDYEYGNGFHLQANFDTATLTVKETIDNIIHAIELGYVNPLDAFAVFKELEKRFNEAKKQIDELAYNESEKYDKTFKIGSYQFTRVEGRKQFDFKNIDEWKVAKENLVQIENKYKSVYENQKNNISSLNEQTGEVLQTPIVTFSKSSLSVKNK